MEVVAATVEVMVATVETLVEVGQARVAAMVSSTTI